MTTHPVLSRPTSRGGGGRDPTHPFSKQTNKPGGGGDPSHQPTRFFFPTNPPPPAGGWKVSTHTPEGNRPKKDKIDSHCCARCWSRVRSIRYIIFPLVNIRDALVFTIRYENSTNMKTGVGVTGCRALPRPTGVPLRTPRSVAPSRQRVIARKLFYTIPDRPEQVLTTSQPPRGTSEAFDPFPASSGGLGSRAHGRRNDARRAQHHHHHHKTLLNVRFFYYLFGQATHLSRKTL